METIRYAANWFSWRFQEFVVWLKLTIFFVGIVVTVAFVNKNWFNREMVFEAVEVLKLESRK